jgi:branched-chain amino acid aminotransferase
MAQLQRPPYVFMNGKITPWSAATIHVSSEALIRGLSVFEGIKGYWDVPSKQFSLLALELHFRRLQRSTRLLHLPFSMSWEDFRAACISLSKLLIVEDKDLWLRTTVLAVEGNWGLDTVSDLVITGYTQEKQRPAPTSIGVSNWQRTLDSMQPTRIKSAANYQTARIVRMEARRQGYSDNVMMNQWGRVAETSGCAVLMVRNGQVITPPPTEGCLESITVDLLEHICEHLQVPFIRRPVDRTELYVADEICLAGTLAELIPVKQIESFVLPKERPILERLADAFWRCARREQTLPGFSLTPVQ